MKEYIRQIVESEGINVIKEKRLVFLLDDMGAFNNVPKAVRRILIDIIEDGYALKLYNIGSWNFSADTLCHRFIENYGVKDEYAKEVFKALCYGFGWKKEDSPTTVGNNFISNKSKRSKGENISLIVSSLQRHDDANDPDSFYILVDGHRIYFHHIKYSRGQYYQDIRNFEVDEESLRNLELSISFMLADYKPNSPVCFSYVLYNDSGHSSHCNNITFSNPTKDFHLSNLAPNLNLRSIDRFEYHLTKK